MDRRAMHALDDLIELLERLADASANAERTARGNNVAMFD